ncbi:hypothetical protein [Paenibacillus ginsengihumi]|uniref:hypothetical protein n=1 Tax=Paenibacillus ginsengihumi TaxID=431596 RepID=UPI00036237D1|nr:hypothetical protein [Paenibacillus ginsengihumi]
MVLRSAWGLDTVRSHAVMEAQITGKTIVTLLDVPVQPKGFLLAPAYGSRGQA